ILALPIAPLTSTRLPSGLRFGYGAQYPPSGYPTRCCCTEPYDSNGICFLIVVSPKLSSLFWFVDSERRESQLKLRPWIGVTVRLISTPLLLTAPRFASCDPPNPVD